MPIPLVAIQLLWLNLISNGIQGDALAFEKDTEDVMNKKVKHGTLLTVIFTLLSLLYLYPIVLVFINSFKKKAYISKAPFEIPTGKMYVGLENYIRGIKQTRLIQAFGWSLFITILSVAVIILCCSMCAWYICRVKTKFTKIFYMLCLFAMIVPFQMEMFTLSKIANMLHMGIRGDWL